MEFHTEQHSSEHEFARRQSGHAQQHDLVDIRHQPVQVDRCVGAAARDGEIGG